MSGQSSDTPPPEVPEEFAAAYREAFQRALGDPGVGRHRDEVASDFDVFDTEFEEYDEESLPLWQRLRVPGLIALLGLVLIGGAYLLGRLVSHSVSDTPATASSARPSAASSTRSSKPSPASHAWKGKVSATPVSSVTASCTMPPGRDSAGRSVSYAADNAIDSRASTAWRCAGSGSGVTLTLSLPSSTAVGQVGIIPGYAKTDPSSGADRYAENNRITRVRWILADGVVVTQTLDPNPHDRSLQVLRVPRTKSDTVRLEILSVERGPRDTTAISEIRVWAAG